MYAMYVVPLSSLGFHIWWDSVTYCCWYILCFYLSVESWSIEFIFNHSMEFLKFFENIWFIKSIYLKPEASSVQLIQNLDRLCVDISPPTSEWISSPDCVSLGGMLFLNRSLCYINRFHKWSRSFQGPRPIPITLLVHFRVLQLTCSRHSCHNCRSETTAAQFSLERCEKTSGIDCCLFLSQ